jgi:hypothetical protein
MVNLLSSSPSTQAQRLVKLLAQYQAGILPLIASHITNLRPDFHRVNSNGDSKSGAFSGSPATMSTAFVGARVVRGPAWHYNDQDGGEGNVGTILEVSENEWIRVEWANGSTNSYECPNPPRESTLAFADSQDTTSNLSLLFGIVRDTFPMPAGQALTADSFTAVSHDAEHFLVSAVLAFIDASLAQVLGVFFACSILLIPTDRPRWPHLWPKCSQ